MTRSRRPTLGALLVLVAMVPLVAVWFPKSNARVAPPSATALEAVLLSPCCYGGTLDVPDSEIARDLRAEIETRVSHGESTAAVEEDLVTRFGPRILAMPNEAAFGATIALAMAAVIAAGLALLWLVWRWRRHGPRLHGATASPSGRDAYDDRLDEELANGA